MSHIFQRPLCELGRAYDFAFRPVLGEADPTMGGGCDDRPRRFELCSASADPARPTTDWRSFALCPEHAAQLRLFDERFRSGGRPSRFRG